MCVFYASVRKFLPGPEGAKKRAEKGTHARLLDPSESPCWTPGRGVLVGAWRPLQPVGVSITVSRDSFLPPVVPYWPRQTV